jgi:hypothetical protein
MNVLLTLFNKNNGTIEGTKRISLPLYCYPSDGGNVFYIEPDDTLNALDPTFSKYDCLVEVL